MSFIGLHLSGANTHKTALVVLSGATLRAPFRVERIYERIGSRGKLFSDERLIDIVAAHAPLEEIVIDCPLSVPPCVACTRPTCPGVMNCDDRTLAYMLRLAEASPYLLKRHKRKPVNPQTHRLWDLIEYIDRDRSEPFVPSYNASLAPLNTRARVLQRRLHQVAPDLELCETEVGESLRLFCEHLRISEDAAAQYKNFEVGKKRRREILLALVERGWLRKLGREEENDLLPVETFQALIAALVGGLKAAGLVAEKPTDPDLAANWVYLPRFADPRMRKKEGSWQENALTI